MLLNSGYFGDSFADWSVTISSFLFYNLLFTHIHLSLQVYGAKVDQLSADFGAAVSKSELEKALRAKKYKAVAFTHVDTSTGQSILKALSLHSFLSRCLI